MHFLSSKLKTCWFSSCESSWLDLFFFSVPAPAVLPWCFILDTVFFYLFISRYPSLINHFTLTTSPTDSHRLTSHGTFTCTFFFSSLRRQRDKRVTGSVATTEPLTRTTESREFLCVNHVERCPAIDTFLRTHVTHYPHSPASIPPHFTDFSLTNHSPAPYLHHRAKKDPGKVPENGQIKEKIEERNPPFAFYSSQQCPLTGLLDAINADTASCFLHRKENTPSTRKKVHFCHFSPLAEC